MTSFGHSKPCQKTMYIYASLSLIISLIKLMSINYTYNNKKNLTWIFMKGAECYTYYVHSQLTITITRRPYILLLQVILRVGQVWSTQSKDHACPLVHHRAPTR